MPCAMHSLISPIPMAVTEDPPTPLTAHAEIGQSMTKSDLSTVAPALT